MSSFSRFEVRSLGSLVSHISLRAWDTTAFILTYNCACPFPFRSNQPFFNGVLQPAHSEIYPEFGASAYWCRIYRPQHLLLSPSTHLQPRASLFTSSTKKISSPPPGRFSRLREAAGCQLRCSLHSFCPQILMKPRDKSCIVSLRPTHLAACGILLEYSRYLRLADDWLGFLSLFTFLVRITSHFCLPPRVFRRRS